ncbi:MAG: hypothetical protein ACMVY4_04165 [Minwuia sp.]|uniref:hypothetical protein n=1 Tax=Minwuia sp. TaxID=2493630 RepID=UPI003A89754E
MAKADKTPNITVMDEANGLLLGGRFTPDLSRPLPHLSMQGAQAFAVEDENGNAEDYYCVLCAPGTYVRHSAIQTLIEKTPRHMRLPHACATVRLKDGKHFFAIVFDHARARPLLTAYGGKTVPERDLSLKVLPDIITCLLDLSGPSLAHRGLRASNVLLAADGDVILDQCVIHLPGEGQDAAHEPPISAQASPGGRGEGAPSDDYFALGVLTMELLTGKVPGTGVAPSTFWGHRILRGSYSTMLDRRKFTTAIQALLAGTLVDESHRRWAAGDLRAWAGGHWDMPRNTGTGRRANMPFLFEGRDYHSPELLAWAFHGNITEASRAIVAGRVEKWVRNVLEDSRASDFIEASRRPYLPGDELSEYDACELVCRICMALDPNGPLRFRNLVVPPTGIPGLIWTALNARDQDRLDSLDHLLGTNLLTQWQEVGGRAVRAALPNFVTSSITSIMAERSRHGFGLERVLYETLPKSACIGAQIADAMPLTLADLLLALERKAQSDPNTVAELDRHVVAFILTKDRNTEATIRAAYAPGLSDIEQLTAIGDVLGMVQRNHCNVTCTGLTRAVSEAMKPAMHNLRSKVRRMVLQQKIDKLAEGGDLSALVRELDVKHELKNDEDEFHAARARIKAIEQLIEVASTHGYARTVLAQKRGYRYARLFSNSIAFVTVFYFSMLELL